MKGTGRNGDALRVVSLTWEFWPCGIALKWLGHPLQDQEQHLGTDFQTMFLWGSATPLYWDCDLTLPHHCTGTYFLLQVLSGICSPGFCTWLTSFSYFLFYFAGPSHSLPRLLMLFLGWKLPNVYTPSLKSRSVILPIDSTKNWHAQMETIAFSPQAVPSLVLSLSW